MVGGNGGVKMFYFARPDVTGLPIADLVEGKVFLRRGVWKCHGKGHQGKARERGGRAADD